MGSVKYTRGARFRLPSEIEPLISPVLRKFAEGQNMDVQVDWPYSSLVNPVYYRNSTEFFIFIHATPLYTKALKYIPKEGTLTLWGNKIR